LDLRKPSCKLLFCYFTSLDDVFVFTAFAGDY